MYYQYKLAHFKGNMGHDATSDGRGLGILLCYVVLVWLCLLFLQVGLGIGVVWFVDLVW
jgi:hypothetical protein